MDTSTTTEFTIATNVKRFRVLIVGNANAGKTTILDKVCHANGRKPLIVGQMGRHDLRPSNERGEHTIDTEFVYPTAEGFIFHDSCGFESGSVDELHKVKNFLEKRTKAERLEDGLHAIWYCIPTSNDRPFTVAEIEWLKDIRDVPIIVIFTKMDVLENRAFAQLLDRGMAPRDAKQEAPNQLKEIFQRDYLIRLQEVVPGQRSVQFRDMQKPDTRCDALLLETARALDSRILLLLNLSMRRNQLFSNIKTAINQATKSLNQVRVGFFARRLSKKQQASLLKDMTQCFPHVLVSVCIVFHYSNCFLFLIGGMSGGGMAHFTSIF
ncbi:hypothetical protein V8E55_010054 [Tylopilus felleus]